MIRRRPRQRPATANPFTPDAIEVHPRHLQIGDEWVASFAVTGYPREVHAGWLQPLVTYPGRLDVSLHIEPIDPRVAADRLRKQLGRLEAGRRHTATHGQLHDPEVEAATHDAHDLSEQIARGEGRLFRFGLLLTVHADSEQELTEEISALRAVTASLLIDATPTTYRSLQGWVSTLPIGLDQIGMTRAFDTAALSAAFPFASPDLPAPEVTSASTASGVLYGYNLGSQGLVHWDRFAQENYNAIILGRSGAGKSYLVKLEAIRWNYRGVQIAIIDPEDEYADLARAVGGTHFPLGAEGIRLNPLDVPIHTRSDGRRSAPSDALTRRSLFVQTLLSVLFGESLNADEQAVLDQAVNTTYQHAGITADARTWTRPAPVLADLRAVLESDGRASAKDLAHRLQPYTEGAYRGLFDGPTTTLAEGHLLVFSLRNLPDELKPVGTLLALDAVSRQISNPALRRPRLCVVDEAWLLMQQPAGANFLWHMAKSARKHWCGLTVATQDVGDVLGSDLGKAIVSNAATQILLRQAPQAIDDVAHTFALSEGQRQFLLSADTGQGVLTAGNHQVALQAVASNTEHALITTDPAELAAMSHEPAGDAEYDSDAAHDLVLDD